jgi:hypothetical protein
LRLIGKTLGLKYIDIEKFGGNRRRQNSDNDYRRSQLNQREACSGRQAFRHRENWRRTIHPGKAVSPLDLRDLYKFKILSETRREQKIAATHMSDMLGAIFYEQRSIVAGFGFTEIPFMR